jgi:crotonobetainyl-CoA:carnitine CoA-transferase CaiB-like acyl-CoA transferase
MSALAGLRVIDLSRRMSAAWCTRLLADFGAEVTATAPEAVAALGPRDRDGHGIPGRYVLANKHVRPGPTPPLPELAGYDVIVDDFRPGSPERAGLPLAAVAEACPRSVHLSLTAHGQRAALAAFDGNELTASALSGWASVNGLDGRPPLKGSGFQAAYQSGTLAAAAVACALVERAHSGRGQHIDVAEVDVLACTFAPALLRAQYTGASPAQRIAVDFTNGPVPCKDGHFSLTPSRERFWIAAMEVLGLDDLAADVQLQRPATRLRHRDRYIERVHAALLAFTKADLFARLGEREVIAGPAFDMAELGASPHLAARRFFTPHAGTRFPGAPFRMHGSPWRLAEAPPVATAPFAPELPPRAGGGGPLAGYRGVVLTQAWSGTLATQLLGLLGADIIQVEPFTRLDSWRGGYTTPVPGPLRGLPTARHGWNCNPLFNSVNLNKRSLTLDLTKPEGADIFRRLARDADFVAENFSPRVMGNLGLDYAALRRARPDTILLSLSAYGHDGPWSRIPGIGGTIEPSSGMSALMGYPGEGPQNSGQMYPDPVAALNGCLAVALALAHRARTGEGQFIDLSMQEASFTFIGEAWLEHALTGTVPGPRGNLHADLAPHAMYPCAAEDGAARWLAVACPDDAAFAALARIAARPDWHERWPTNAARKADEAALDAELATWTRAQNVFALAAALRAAGVLAAPVLRAAELAHGMLVERGVVVPVVHAEAGVALQAAIPAFCSRTPLTVTRPAPLHGEHTDDVLGGVLGMGKAEIDALVAAGVTTRGSPTAPPDEE